MPRFKELLLFLIAIGVTVLGLKLLKGLPLLIQTQEIQKYTSMNEMQRALKIKKIFLPAYFPQHLQWPPIEIYAGETPGLIILMHFKDQNKDRVILTIRQTDTEDSHALPSRLQLTEITMKEERLIKRIPATITCGLCSDGEVCNQVHWKDRTYYLTVTAKEPLKELLRMVESMISAPSA